MSFALLRNGWYLENYTENLAPVLEHGTVLGSANDGRFSAASRLDFADAAVPVLTQATPPKQIYELVGDSSFTLAQLAAQVSEQAAKATVYSHLPPAEYEDTLLSFGLPPAFARVLVDSDLGAAKGELESDSNDLAILIGRATTTLATAIAAALQQLALLVGAQP